MSDIQALENQKKDRQREVAIRDLVLKLSNNREFKKVIEEEYCVQEAARFVEVAGNPNLNEQQRKDAMDAAMAPGHLKRWLNARIMMGYYAEHQIVQIDAEIEELRMEGEEE